MGNQYKHNQNGADIDKVLSQFSDAERDNAEKIWQLSKQSRHQKSPISDIEVEEALGNVHFRIDQPEDTRSERSRIAGSIINWSRYLVAAVALVVFGIGIFLVPKTVSVPNSETAVIELPDGSTVELNSGTTLQYNRLFAFTNRSVSMNGEAYFSVEESGEPFIVEANGTAIEVTGTQFNIRSWSDDPASETIVTVTDGNIQFYPAGQKINTVSLSAGQTSRLNTEMTKPSQPTETSTDDKLAWRESRMVFQETPLIIILHELERTFDVSIELDVEDMDFETLTAYYNKPANVESILEDICTVKGLHYTKTSNGYRIFK